MKTLSLAIATRLRVAHLPLLVHQGRHLVARSLAAKPLNRPFFRWIKSSETAAGVTPEIREAWPVSPGGALLSFWRTSKLSAPTCA